MSSSDFYERLKAFEGTTIGGPVPGRDAVNLPMIRHWCDAMGDRNPVYTDPEFAARTLHGGIVAPPTMLQAWSMPGLQPRTSSQRRSSIPHELFELFDGAGFTSVVATNCTQEYLRYLRPGDEISTSSLIESVSEEKQTALGPGHFFTLRTVYRDQHGEEVARMRFRMLRFRPRHPQQAAGDSPPARAPEPRRPRPALTHDNRFFWDGIARRRLLIQRCTGCGELRHPPGPMCPSCHSLAWDALEASGRGRVHSWVVAHHPQIPPFRYPNLIVLVTLEEGTRIVSNLVGVDPQAVAADMPVQAEFHEVEEGRLLLQFAPVG